MPPPRVRINLLVADLESTRSQLLAAKHLASQKAVLVLGNPALAQVAQPQSFDALTPQEKKALASAISEKTLEHWGWKVDKSGRVLTERGQVIFAAGFATAVKKLSA